MRYLAIAALCAVAACGGGDTASDAALREARMAIAPPSASQWSALIPLTLVPAAAANLPDGKVLLWSSDTRFSFGGGGQTYTTLFDPATSTSTQVLVSNTGHDMFCPGTSNLPDGRLMVTGGVNADRTSLYNPSSGTWTAGAAMKIPRGYNANCVLEDGSVFTIGGSWAGGVGNKHGEVWTEAGGWRRLTGVPVDPMLSVDPSPANSSFGGDSHFWLLPAPNGKVFHAGPGVQMHWIDTQGNGKVTPLGPRGDDEFSVNGNVAMYDVGKVLKTGGAPAYEDVNANANAYVIDLNAGMQLRRIASMNYRRAYHNSVVLPNGQVLIVGGMTFARNFTDNTAVLAAELFDPATETFTVLPPVAVGRTYHSVALLLPDARVLSAGGGLCGTGCAANHPDLQILTPHYLLNADGTAATRPVITSAPAAATHGTRITVGTDSTIGSFALIRLSSNTHAVNNDQRRVPLAHTSTGPNTYELQIPGNPGVVLPGYYMLFALSPAGVPSVSRTIRIGGDGAPRLTNPGDQSGFVNLAATLTVTATNATTYAASGLPPGLAIDAGSGVVSGTPSQAGRYAVTVSAGNAVATSSTVFVWDVAVPGTGVRHVRLEALSEVSGQPWASMAEFDLLDAGGAVMARTGWAVTVDSAEPSGGAVGNTGAGINAIDGNPATMWHTLWSTGNPPHPHTFTVDLGGVRSIGGFRYLPRNDASTNGTIAAWRFHTSSDGSNWTLVAQGNFLDLGDPRSEKTILFGAPPPPNRPPALAPVANQSSSAGQNASLALSASDPDGDTLAYAATGLPPGLAINATSGLISGTPTTPGTYAVTAEASDNRGGVASQAFGWTIAPQSWGIDPVLAPPVAAGSTATFNASAGGSDLRYSWNFGDGSPATAPSPSATASTTYAAPGLYTVTVTAVDGAGTVRTLSFIQAVHAPPAGSLRPTQSTTVAFENRAPANPRVWLVNPDNDSVSVFDAAATPAKLGEIAVGQSPRSVAIGPDGRIWVANKGSASLSVISPDTLAVVQTVGLPRASMPHGLAFAPDGSAGYVALEATGQLLRFDPASGATTGSVGVGPNPRHLAVLATSGKVLVSRFVSPPLPGEATATVATEQGGAARGGEVVVVSGSMSVETTVVLRHSDKPDTTLQGAGLPNYLGAAAVSPDGASAWVPSKQDNVRRGTLRNGLNLDFQNTVRAISSRIDLAGASEDHPARIDHDNAGLASAAAFHTSGAYLFVALQTSRQVAVVDPVQRLEILRFDTGRAPDGLAVSADGLKLYVDHFMDRTLGVYDLGRLVNYGELIVTPAATLSAVASEKLTAQVLQGKRLFYDARDTRLARDAYVSCAACHNDGGHDGRVWDFTGFGEGLRNTISLRGRGGAQGFLHWSNNFDEVHDFEGQIRALAGGTGLMADSAFNAGTRSQPLGSPKAGLSADLDALAAYVASLATFAPSPHRPSATALSALAGEGRAVFGQRNCASCHAGSAFTNSGANTLVNIGTVKPSSGQRSGAPLTGIDVPTLRDVWATAPYLHDGSAPTLEDAVRAHSGFAVPDAELPKLAAYLREIGSDEGPAPTPTGYHTIWPSSAVPGIPTETDTGSINIGVKFRSDVDGFIAGIRFYKGTGNTGTHVGTLWTSSGAQLASATFTNETASGWQQVNFASPVQISANTVYVASYFAPNGRYEGEDGYFAARGVDSPPLHALRDGESGGNGVYRYAGGVAFPNQTYQSENYWVDVLFMPVGGPDTVAPTVSSVSPPDGATSVSRTGSVGATFSEPVDPASVGPATFELRDASGAAVAASVSYDAATRIATLQPGAALAASTTYTATVRGGGSDPRIKDLAGNPLAASRVWSFTTVAAGDTTAPTVTARSPAAGATGVSRTANVTATFSESIDTATVGTSTFELRDPTGTLVAAAVSYNATTRVATLNPTPTLAAGQAYTATVRGGSVDPRVKDLAGNALAADAVWSFTTVPDTAPPTITATSPASGATGVSRTANVTATFNEAMDPATIGTLTFELRGPGNTVVPAVVSWNATSRKATLNPNPTLAALTTYTAIVRGGSTDPRAKDVAGNALAADRVWTFTTR